MARHRVAAHPKMKPRLLLILTFTVLIYSGKIAFKNNASKSTPAANSVPTVHENAVTKSPMMNATLVNVSESLSSEYIKDNFYSSTSQTNETEDRKVSSPINFTEKVTLSQREILGCLSTNGRLRYDAREVDIRYTQVESEVDKGQDEPLSCLVYLTAPHDMVMHLQFVDMDLRCSNENFVHVYDGREDSYYRNVPIDGCEVVNDVYSTVNVAYFDIRIGNRNVEFSIHIKLTAVPFTTKPQLELHFSSLDHGMQSFHIFFND